VNDHRVEFVITRFCEHLLSIYCERYTRYIGFNLESMPASGTLDARGRELRIDAAGPVQAVGAADGITEPRDVAVRVVVHRSHVRVQSRLHGALEIKKFIERLLTWRSVVEVDRESAIDGRREYVPQVYVPLPA